MRCSSSSSSSLIILLAGGLSPLTTAFAPSHRLIIVSSQNYLPRTPAIPLTKLWESTTGGVDGSDTAVDFDALLKYHAAVGIQLSLFAGLFFGIDTIVAATPGIDTNSIPTLALVPLFYILSLKSRIFNPLDNARPNMKKAIDGDTVNTKPSRGFGDRIMPTWTPPGVIFPIMWVLIIGPIRAYSTALVWQANGHVFLDPTIMALMFHLAVGDVWNTINNTEQRFGASVTGVLCVTASALNAAYQYYTVDETAGHLLGLPMIWFAVASSLIAATWQLNPNVETGEVEPLYPVVRPLESTKFAWFGVNRSS
jgi:benzodiazapine receptor